MVVVVTIAAADVGLVEASLVWAVRVLDDACKWSTSLLDDVLDRVAVGFGFVFDFEEIPDRLDVDMHNETPQGRRLGQASTTLMKTITQKLERIFQFG